MFYNENRDLIESKVQNPYSKNINVFIPICLDQKVICITPFYFDRLLLENYRNIAGTFFFKKKTTDQYIDFNPSPTFLRSMMAGL